MLDKAERGQGTAMGALGPAAVLLAAGLAALLWARLAPGPETRLVLALLLPPQNVATLLAGTPDAALLGPGGLPGSWIVTSQRSDLARRLQAAGAWLVLNATGAAQLCAPPGRNS